MQTIPGEQTQHETEAGNRCNPPSQAVPAERTGVRPPPAAGPPLSPPSPGRSTKAAGPATSPRRDWGREGSTFARLLEQPGRRGGAAERRGGGDGFGDSERTAPLPPPPSTPPRPPGPGEWSGRSIPPRLPRHGASLPSPLPAAAAEAAVPARVAAKRRFPQSGLEGSGAPGRGAGPPGHPAPRQAPSPPTPGTPCLGEVINPTPPTAPTVMFVTACPSLGVERSMTGLCCLNKNQRQLKGENSSY
ncbi:PREDICTED: basic proline-rich protein-like [Lepidothrix coronata]|uniref:Basic proline-rich protein-like n=1 Tax=Lepidothrix coronata TaxID=321398 RepID=A0A6J0IQZ8_9PASS|nr:PREDICTED: basic proline-rich protein-like [Lepidothrix coronata]